MITSTPEQVVTELRSIAILHEEIDLESDAARETIDRYFGRPAEAVMGGIVVESAIDRDIYVDLDRRELRVGLKQEGWARLGRISVSHDGSSALSALEIDLDDGGHLKFQTKSGLNTAGVILGLIKRGITLLAREYGYYTPEDKLADQLNALDNRLQAAKHKSITKSRLSNALSNKRSGWNGGIGW